MPNSYHQLLNYCKQIAIKSSVQSVLSWDQETYMPEDAIQFRSEQCAWLAKTVHHD